MVDIQVLAAQGRRGEMEDAHCVETLGPQETLVGIFDGHQDGGKVAEMGAKNLRRLFEAAEGLAIERLPIALAQLHANVGLLNLHGGSCALAFHLAGPSLAVVSLGDSGLVWVPAGETRGLPLSTVHRLDNPQECYRVYQAGAVLQKPYWLHPQTGRGLMPTRTLGDLELDGPWLSREPFRATAELEGEGYLIAACDGFWDVFNPDQVALLINEGGPEESLEARTKRVADAALAHPQAQDNLTLVLLHFSTSDSESEPEPRSAPVNGQNNVIPLPLAQAGHQGQGGDGLD